MFLLFHCLRTLKANPFSLNLDGWRVNVIAIEESAITGDVNSLLKKLLETDPSDDGSKKAILLTNKSTHTNVSCYAETMVQCQAALSRRDDLEALWKTNDAELRAYKLMANHFLPPPDFLELKERPKTPEAILPASPPAVASTSFFGGWATNN